MHYHFFMLIVYFILVFQFLHLFRHRHFFIYKNILEVMVVVSLYFLAPFENGVNRVFWFSFNASNEAVHTITSWFGLKYHRVRPAALDKAYFVSWVVNIFRFLFLIVWSHVQIVYRRFWAIEISHFYPVIRCCESLGSLRKVRWQNPLGMRF